VGLLKAAELHGATHHAVMEFQVVSDKRMPAIRAGRSKIVFYYRKDLSAVSAGIEERNTDTGTMKVSSPELTILDLLRYPNASGGLDNIITVIGDLGSKLDYEKLASLARAFERSILQRAGYLLDFAGFQDKTDVLRKSLDQGSTLPWIELEPSLIAKPELAPAVLDRDQRWHVIVRRVPERDE
jgi:predicted transcriptional regulator of viral defense system